MTGKLTPSPSQQVLLDSSSRVDQLIACTEANPNKCINVVSFYDPNTLFEERRCLPIKTFTIGSVSAVKTLSVARRDGASRKPSVSYLSDRTPLTLLGFFNRSTHAKVASIDPNHSSSDIVAEVEAGDGTTYYIPWKYLGGDIAVIRSEAAR